MIKERISGVSGNQSHKMTLSATKRSCRPLQILVILLLLIFATLPLIQFHQLDPTSTRVNDGTRFELEPFIPSNYTTNSPRFIVGIMSHDQYWQEKERRATIRITYLSFFARYEKWDRNRICALKDLVAQTENISLWNQCQLAYAFVVGGATTVDQNPTWNRTELLEPTVSSQLLTKTTHSEPDVVSLNIQENGKFGKSPTWFRYASLLLKELEEKQRNTMNGNDYLPFDYIMKTDSDTLIIPKRVMRWVEEQEQEEGIITSQQGASRPQRQAIYGGSAFDKKMCGFPSHEHCALLQAPVYMGGALYFVSTDLADYISSPQCPRSKLFIPHEDMTMGNYVHSYENYFFEQHGTARKVVRMSHPEAYLSTWIHPVKNPKRMKGLWRKYIQNYKKRLLKMQLAKDGSP